MPAQDQWKWCQKCMGLVFTGTGSGGACPAGGAHDTSTSGDYSLSFGIKSTQDQWKWCQKCMGLVFTGTGSGGACPAGGAHDTSTSGDYSLMFL